MPFEIIRKNTAELDRPQVPIWHISTACWILQATDKHSQYAILTAFPLRQRLYKHTSTLCHMGNAHLVLHLQFPGLWMLFIISYKKNTFWELNLFCPQVATTQMGQTGLFTCLPSFHLRKRTVPGPKTLPSFWSTI